nr:MAG TPA: hypothetical protein [Caudoviricetes sp.]
MDSLTLDSSSLTSWAVFFYLKISILTGIVS